MIDLNSEIAVAEFGEGDISIIAVITDKDDGILLMRNIDKKPIGYKFDKLSLEEFLNTKILMKFSNQESIDVLIRQLCNLKAMMYGQLGDVHPISGALIDTLSKE